MSAGAHESDDAIIRGEAGVSEQLDSKGGDLIFLSLEGKEVIEVETEQQVNSPQDWSELEFTEVMSGAMDVEKEHNILEPVSRSTQQPERAEMEISSELRPGTSCRRVWEDPQDLQKGEGCEHSKLEEVVSQDFVKEVYVEEGFKEKEEEEGAGEEGVGEEMISESGEWTEVVSRRVKGGGARRGHYKNGVEEEEHEGQVEGERIKGNM